MNKKGKYIYSGYLYYFWRGIKELEKWKFCCGIME